MLESVLDVVYVGECPGCNVLNVLESVLDVMS